MKSYLTMKLMIYLNSQYYLHLHLKHRFEFSFWSYFLWFSSLIHPLYFWIYKQVLLSKSWKFESKNSIRCLLKKFKSIKDCYYLGKVWQQHHLISFGNSSMITHLKNLLNLMDYHYLRLISIIIDFWGFEFSMIWGILNQYFTLDCFG